LKIVRQLTAECFVTILQTWLSAHVIKALHKWVESHTILSCVPVLCIRGKCQRHRK